MGKETDKGNGRDAAWEPNLAELAGTFFHQSRQMSEAQRAQLWNIVIRQIRSEFLGGPKASRSSNMMKTVDGGPSWRDKQLAQAVPAKAQALMTKAGAEAVSPTANINLYNQLVEVARAEAKAHPQEWGQTGSLEELDLPEPYSGSAFKGSFKCNIFINTALIRAGLMHPGMKGADTPKGVHPSPPNVNGMVDDVEAVAAGNDVDPAHGMRWFDIVSADEAKAGDLIAIRGRERGDKDPLEGKRTSERNGHIELIMDIERNADGSFKRIGVVGAASDEAKEHSIGGRTFGINDAKTSKFTPHAGTWFLRARPMPSAQ